MIKFVDLNAWACLKYGKLFWFNDDGQFEMFCWEPCLGVLNGVIER